MTPEKINKIGRFLADPVMEQAVQEVLQNVCLTTSKDRDVQNLAARFIAIEILNEAWKELKKHKNHSSEETKEKTGHV